MSERLALRVGEAAAAIGVSRSKAYELIQSGELPSVRIGHSIRVPLDALRDLLNARASGDHDKPPAQRHELISA